MNWQAWAIQGAVLTCAAFVTAFATSMASIDDKRVGRFGWPTTIALFTAATASFIVAGWIAPWSVA
jgi:hypothetical protein